MSIERASISVADQPDAAVELWRGFQNVRRSTLALAANLSDADASAQSMADASPAKWHLAHTTWFFETFVLRDFDPTYRFFDRRYSYLFNSYYEAEGARIARPARGLLTRPSLEDVRAYRAHVDAAMERSFCALPLVAQELVALGCHHEQQHQELLLTDICHLFAQNPLFPAAWAPSPRPATTPEPSPLGWIEGRRGAVQIGHGGSDFAFDCEGPRHTAWLSPHALGDRLITNAEWRAFIDDGGYRSPGHWLSEGWNWVGEHGVEAPLYWRRDENGEWTRHFGLDGLTLMNPCAPVRHISFYEADAFARWAGARLPTEAEWESAAEPLNPEVGNFLDSAGPVEPRPAEGEGGIRQLFGDLWEWTGSAFLAHPGFRPAPGAVGEYNGKFMSGQFVLKGGSCATPRGHARGSYRELLRSSPSLAVHRRSPGQGHLMFLAERPEVTADTVPADPAFRADVLAGFSLRPRAIPARWFYDRRGSELFEAITKLPEYYPTRAETAVLAERGPDIAALTGRGRAVVEFGSGSSSKTPLLLSAISPSAYVPIDISGEFLQESAKAIEKAFPGLKVHPLEADFTRQLVLPRFIEQVPRLGFFPGSTIGNLRVSAAVDLLRVMAKSLGDEAMLLIGVDRIKSRDMLLPAYDDQQGVTAKFNLNLLHRINRELDGTIPVEMFRHVVRWNDPEARIEMHLEASRDVRFTIEEHGFSMGEGETIHTENSLKYGPRDARLLLRAGGWTPIAEWTDADGFFALMLATRSREVSAP